MNVKDKKYYWLKLKKDFFKRHDIQIIESQKNGAKYVLFYLKLLAESVGHEGALRFNELIPYNEEMLSTITNTDIDTVRSAIKLLEELKMVDMMDDGTIYMTEVNNMLGHETYWAKKKREQRDVKLLDIVQSGPICPSKSIELELEKEINIKATKIPYTDILKTWNNTKELSSIRILHDKRKKKIKKVYQLDDGKTFKEIVTRAINSEFMVEKKLTNIDWMMNENNYAKILEGKYDNKE
jgi:predicted phage replisome organizer